MPYADFLKEEMTQVLEEIRGCRPPYIGIFYKLDILEAGEVGPSIQLILSTAPPPPIEINLGPAFSQL